MEEREKRKITVREYRKLPKDQQDEIWREVQAGKIEIVRTNPRQTPVITYAHELGGSHDVAFTSQGVSGRADGVLDSDLSKNPSCSASFIASLHPKAIRARFESWATKAEEQAARMIAEGNIAQAKLLEKFLEEINNSPELSQLVYSEAKASLPPEVNIDDLSPREKLSVLTNALARVTAMPIIIQAYEEAIGRNAKEVAQIQAAIDLARQLAPYSEQLLMASGQLSEVNRALIEYNREQAAYIRLKASAERNRLAEDSLVLSSQATGIVGGFTGGIVAGTAAIFAYAGDAMRTVAEKAPIPMLGGALGLVVYALNNMDQDIFTLKYLGEAFVSFGIGAIALPTLIGIAEGLFKISKNR